jgi:hypothetical protein
MPEEELLGNVRGRTMKSDKHDPQPPPLVQISWITRKKGQTRTAVITLGSPLLAVLLFLGGSQLGHLQKIAKSIWIALGGGG